MMRTSDDEDKLIIPGPKMGTWDCIPEVGQDLIDYFRRQNTGVNLEELEGYLGEYLNAVADDDAQLLARDGEMAGLRTGRLRNINGGEETLIAVRRKSDVDSVLMCVAIVHREEARLSEELSSDVAIQMRINLGMLKLLQRKN